MHSFHSNHHQLQCNHLWDNQGVSMEMYMEFETANKFIKKAYCFFQWPTA